MTDGHPGWFKDPNDGALARWHDGDDWTEHTLVIADQVPGEEPEPPVPTTSSADVYFGGGRSRAGDSNKSRDGAGLPTWAKVVAPLAVVLIGIFGFSMLSGGDDDAPSDEQVDTADGSLDDAVEAARSAGLPDAISDARAAALIQRICDAAQTPADAPRLGADLGQLPAASESELRTAVSALGEGAEERCAEDMADADDLMGDLQDAAFASFTTTTTAPTITGDTVPGEVTDGAVDGGDTEGSDAGDGTTRTTKKGTTATTKPRTTTSTTAPTTTTTKSKIQPGQACSTEGAKATDFVGKPVTCVKKGCIASAKSFTWRSSPCPPQQTVPTTAPGTPTPTAPTTPPTNPNTTDGL